MEASHPPFDIATYVWPLLATLFFLLANGFFVAAEFGLVAVRRPQIQALAEAGSKRARVVDQILQHLDSYLSACQLGITLSSLILGWLAEPAIAKLLLAGVAGAGLELDPSSALVHGVALGIALTIVTYFHMTIGEQAPKIWALNRAEATSLFSGGFLRVFALIFQPFIWVINESSNGMLRLAGISADELHEAKAHTADELKRVLESSAAGGHISARQLELAQNVIEIIGLEVRHIMVPRLDVEYLSLADPLEEAIRLVRDSDHSRFPLCADGLDSVLGIVHAKQLLTVASGTETVDLRKEARKPLFVSDTQSVSRLIFQLQRTGNHCSVVVDEHGTTIGLAFLEDALEEIVGPIRDEFDDVPNEDMIERSSGIVEVSGSLALPEAAAELDLGELTEAADTIGGYVVARLGRLPRRGDTLAIGSYTVTVSQVARRRVERLRFEPAGSS